MLQLLFSKCYNSVVIQVLGMACRCSDLAQRHSSLQGSLGSERVQGCDTT